MERGGVRIRRMILDPNGVAHAVGIPQTTQSPLPRERGSQREQPATESMLVFRAGSPNPKAVLLSLVTRLEEIDARTIEHLNGRPVVHTAASSCRSCPLPPMQ